MLRDVEGHELTFAFHSSARELLPSAAGQEASFASAVVTFRGVGAGGVSWAYAAVIALVHT